MNPALQGTPIPVMFLGGPLDHTTRLVESGLIDRRKPREQHYIAAKTNYELAEVSSGDKVWWVYVRMGYHPPVGHVINTMPAHLKPQEATP